MKKIIKLSFWAAIILISASCTKNFQEINTTQNQPTSVTIAPIINYLDSSLILGYQEQAGVCNDWYYECSQLAGETALSGYLVASSASEIWNGYYSALQNINFIQDSINAASDKERYNNVQAILYTLKAYKTFRVTDQFGDIPFFKAGKAYTGDVNAYRPAYDNQQAIYDTLLSNLYWAVANINTSANPTSSKGNAYYSIGSQETLLGNNMAKWKAFANSLMLRYAIQIYEKDPVTSAKYVGYALANNVFVSDGNDVALWPASLANYDLAARPWSFGSGGTGYLRISSTMWNMVANGTDSSNIFDPRALVFASTNAAGNWASYTIGSTVSDKVNAYTFTTGSYTPQDKKGCLYSTFNYFLVRDEHYIPEIIITSAEVHFLKAEAYLRGIGVTQSTASATTEYNAGITASVAFWYNIAQNCNTTEAPWSVKQPLSYTSTQLSALLANSKVVFTTDNTANLKKIYAQEWLDNFRQPWLAFNLWRRTGLTPTDAAAVLDGSHATFYRLPYPQDEAKNNTDNYNAELQQIGGSNSSSVKMWWMK